MSEKTPTSDFYKEVTVVDVVDVVDVAAVQPSRTNESTVAPIPKDVWHTGFWKRFPWLGFCGLLGVLVCAAMQAVVLVISDGKEVNRWSSKVTPNVLLNIFNSLSGILFGIAITNGVAIVWWRKALKGTTIKDLHNSWCFTTSFKDVFLKWRYFNAAALAALVTKLTVLDGTLFQKATSTKLMMSSGRDIPITTYPTETFPTTGYFDPADNTTNSIAPYFADDINQWLQSAGGEISSVYGYYECTGTCFVQSQGIGFTVDCTTSTEQVDYAAYLSTLNTTADFAVYYDLFNVDLTVQSPTPEKPYSWIRLDTLHTVLVEGDLNNKTQQCPSDLIRHTCELRPSVISYPVTMTFFNTTTDGNDSTSVHVYLGQLDMNHVSYNGLPDYDPSMTVLPGFEFIKHIDVNQTLDDNGENQLGGILYSLMSQYGGKSQLFNQDFGGYTTATSGLFPALKADTLNNDPRGTYQCPWGYTDPLPDIVRGINSLMFIASNDAFNRDSVLNQQDVAAAARNITGTQFLQEIHYTTDYLYILGALIVTVFCVSCVLPSYWGFWQLGRKATLSPIEIANAFQAPVLAEAHHRNGHAEEILKATGKNKVHYTEFTDEERGTSYRIITRNA